MSILWQAFKNNNKVFGNAGEKEKKSDFQLISKLLLNHSIDSEDKSRQKVFEKSQVIQTVEYVKRGFIQHHNLLLFVLDNVQEEEDVTFTV